MLLAIRNLVFGWNKTTLFDNISCNLHEGEISQLKGENGAGKSTLLQLISGMFPHFNRGTKLQGDILIHERSIFMQPPKIFFPIIAIIPGTYLDFLLFTETLAQEIIITSAITKLNPKETEQRIMEFSTFFPVINSVKDVPFKLMNFDQKALALTLIFYLQKPQLFLFDEIINPASSHAIQQWTSFFNHLGAQGCAVIFVNHQHPINDYPCWMLKNKTLHIT